MGIFHFIFAKYAYGNPYAAVEHGYQNHSIDAYNEIIQTWTSHYYNIGLYNKIFRPLKISASCNPRQGRFPNGRPEYFHFYTPARSYSSPGDNRGRLLSDDTRNGASGGLYLSAKDLAKFMSALDDPRFLHPSHKARMINNGDSDDLYGFWAAPGAVGGRSFVHNGARYSGGDASIAQVVRFPTGAHAVFIANSPANGVNVQNTLIAAYNLARQ